MLHIGKRQEIQRYIEIPRNRAKRMLVQHNAEQIRMEGGPKLLSSAFQNGCWAGKRCFIIGGGPSLKGFDFARLAGELVIGVNRSFEVIDPTIQVSIDDRFIGWAQTGHFGAIALRKWQNMTAAKAFIHYSWTKLVPLDHYFVPCNRAEGFGWDIDKLGHMSNSGYSALNVACCLGASDIYLLGFDMQVDPATGKEWFHDGYKLQRKRDPYPQFMEYFYKYADEIRGHGINVWNANPNSALKVFPFCNIDEVLQQKQSKPPVIASEPVQESKKPAEITWVGYYTDGTGYAKEAEVLKNSLLRHGQKFEIEGVPNLGSWQKNTQFKAEFLRSKVFEHFGETIVYTDCDSELRESPVLFDAIPDTADIGYHLHRGNEMLSGTLFLRCTEKTMELMDLWVAECAENPDKWDQECLWNAVQKSGVKKYMLPAEYCCIFDAHPEITNPVIVHYQASRRLKNTVKGNANVDEKQTRAIGSKLGRNVRRRVTGTDISGTDTESEPEADS